MAGAEAPETAAAPAEEKPDISWKFDLVRSVGEECQTEAELRKLLEKKPEFVLYDGFEPSGRMHIAQGIFKSIAVNKCTKAGGLFTFWVADWFALMNDKMGGDEAKIRVVGEYLIEVWKASGMDMSRVKFLWSSTEISNNADAYWGQAIDIASRITLARVKKCCQIMGRKENSLTAAQILYPIMQCTDIFFLKADICQLGVDQRKVNMLARDYCDLAGRKLKPIILSHHMLFGLKAGQAKMSKSDADSAIFMEDSPEDVARKIKQAHCPREADNTAPEEDEETTLHLVKDDLKNPCLDYIKHILFRREGYVFEAGGQTYSDFEAVKSAFVAGDLSEDALKARLIDDVNALLEPVRTHFKTDERAKGLLEKVTAWRRETLTPTVSLTRLSALDASLAEAPAFVVFSPLPSHLVTVECVMQVIKSLQAAPEGTQRVLWLDDWSTRAQGYLGGSAENIEAFHELLLHGLEQLAPKLMAQVKVHRQSAAILSCPADYWCSVINAGRRHSLEQIEAALPSGSSLVGAGQVVASLMHMGDIMALGGRDGTILCTTPGGEGLHTLAAEYLESCGLTKPKVHTVEACSLWLKESRDGALEDGQILLSDQDPDLNGKIKKAFAEPQNVAVCPLLSWVGVLLQVTGESFTVPRKPDSGGDKTYSEVDAVRADFASGELHPGDLKPALSKSLNAALGDLRKGIKSNAKLKKAVEKLAAYQKSLLKKGR